MMTAMQNSSELRGELLRDEPLSRHTSWRVGGPARCYYRPADRDDLLLFLRQIDTQEPLLWLGLGSNLLVRDGGFAGTVIATHGCLNEMRWLDGTNLYAESGVSCAKLSRQAVRAGLCGIEFLAGIPGTLGGALMMNAGAFGGETWRQVAWVETVDRQGEVHRRSPDDFEIGYRSVSAARQEWFLAAGLQLQQGDAEAALAKVKALLAQRAASQPINQPSCGSVFRNPPGDHAARLIELAGLKGATVGGAQVSEKHANFIINTGDATASDIEQLIELVQHEVHLQHGVELVPEVHRVGVKA